MLTLILSVLKRFAKWFGDIPVDKLFDKD